MMTIAIMMIKERGITIPAPINAAYDIGSS